MEMPQLHQPIPRRTFEIAEASAESSMPPSPAAENQTVDLSLDSRREPPSRTRSILNLTSSTLLGIYSNTRGDGGGYDSTTPTTPWGTGAQTPSIRQSIGELDRASLPRVAWQPYADRPKPRSMSMKQHRAGVWGYYLPIVWQTFMLFAFGIGFGVLVTHLQRTQQISPVPVPESTKRTWGYQLSWGLLGVLIGNALPRIDLLLADNEDAIDDREVDTLQRRKSHSANAGDYERPSLADSGTGPFWHSAVRSIGAFVGIAFAVRRVPWQSTLQVSLTLAVANPVLWYLIDRSRSGFALSTAVGIAGTFLLMLVNPDFVPVPAIHQDQASEQFGVYTWLASILFCTSLCFGAVGRRLHL